MADENARLKEDAVLVQAVSGADAKVDGVKVSSARVQAGSVAGEYSYRIVLLQTGARKKPFKDISAGRQSGAGREQGRRLFAGPAEQGAQAYKLNFRVSQRIEGTFKVDPSAVVRSVQIRLFEGNQTQPKAMQTVTLLHGVVSQKIGAKGRRELTPHFVGNLRQLSNLAAVSVSRPTPISSGHQAQGARRCCSIEAGGNKMFGQRTASRRARSTLLIGTGSRIDGDVRFSGGLRVDGVVSGNIVSDDAGTLVLSEEAVVEGEIRVAHAVINGQVTRAGACERQS